MNSHFFELLGAEGAVHFVLRLEAVFALDVVVLLGDVEEFGAGEFDEIRLDASDLLKILGVVG